MSWSSPGATARPGRLGGREQVRVEREPITGANRDAAFFGPALSEQEHEVTLRAERPVVQTEAVPVERIRLGKEGH